MLEFTKKVENIHNYLYLNNRLNDDPNAYETFDLLIDFNNLKLRKQLPDQKTINKLLDILNNRKENFLRNNLGTNNLAYLMIDHYSEILKEETDEQSRKALLKIASLSLYNAQLKRNKEVFIPSEEELKEVITSIRKTNNDQELLMTLFQNLVKEINN